MDPSAFCPDIDVHSAAKLQRPIEKVEGSKSSKCSRASSSCALRTFPSLGCYIHTGGYRTGEYLMFSPFPLLSQKKGSLSGNLMKSSTADVHSEFGL